MVPYESKDVVARLRYLEDYIACHKPGPSLRSLELQFEDILRQNPFSEKGREQLEFIYTSIRKEERKVPHLDAASAMTRKKPSLSLNVPLANAIEVRCKENMAVVYLDGCSIVAYSASPRDHIGYPLDIREAGLEGRLFFNTDFFQSFDVPKAIETSSDMRNVAKTFFRVNGDAHVALVQYLHPCGASREHYHSLDEVLVQLAGRSFLQIRALDDVSPRTVSLTQGDIYTLPARHLHIVGTLEEGSLTIPMKQTIRGRSDHLVLEKDMPRVRAELDELFISDYLSGNELMSAVVDYAHELSPVERQHCNIYIQERLTREKNPNIRRILEELQTLHP